MTWNRTSGTGTYFTTSGSTFTVAANAPIGTTATYTFTWRPQGSSRNYSATLTFIVSDHNEIIKQSIEGYPVILSILDYSLNKSAYGTMPAEPGVTLNVNYRHIYQNGSKSDFVSKVEPQPGDRLVTLSTCAYAFQNARYIAIARIHSVWSGDEVAVAVDAAGVS